MRRVKSRIAKTIRGVAKPFGYAIVGGGLTWPQLIFNPILRPAGVQLLPATQVGRTYLDCHTTLRKAAEANLSVPDYVARLWEEEGVVEAFVAYLATHVDLPRCRRILEIGAGTGRFLEPIKVAARPDSYEVYETNADWSDYLRTTYDVVAHAADGSTLRYTEDGSQDLVHSHQVFVYLPVRVCLDYLHEMCRVLGSDGYVVFDAYLAEDQSLDDLETWRRHQANYQTMLPRHAILALMNSYGMELIAEYRMRAFVGHTQYLVFARGQCLHR